MRAMCDYDYEPTDVQVFEWIRARKPRPCCACQETIVPGQHYHRCKYLYDGEWSSYDHCGRCFRIVQSLWKTTDGSAIEMGLDCGEVWETPPDDVAALAFALPGECGEADSYATDKRITAP